jgi:hypothetical protein
VPSEFDTWSHWLDQSDVTIVVPFTWPPNDKKLRSKPSLVVLAELVPERLRVVDE